MSVKEFYLQVMVLCICAAEALATTSQWLNTFMWRCPFESAGVAFMPLAVVFIFRLVVTLTGSSPLHWTVQTLIDNV
jgi:hypothetical protein